MPLAPYETVIERGYTQVNDTIIDWLKPRIEPPYVDIGCNTGWLLSEVPGGIGIELSAQLAQRAHSKGLAVYRADACELPFRPKTFRTAILSCILEQVQEWPEALAEARRIAARVLGINPIPKASPWGHIQGYVRTVLRASIMETLGARTGSFDSQRYWFEFA